MREDPNTRHTESLQELIRQNQERLSRNRRTLKEIERRTKSHSPKRPEKTGE